MVLPGGTMSRLTVKAQCNIYYCVSFVGQWVKLKYVQLLIQIKNIYYIMLV